jgi:hypothetical protein
MHQQCFTLLLRLPCNRPAISCTSLHAGTHTEPEVAAHVLSCWLPLMTLLALQYPHCSRPPTSTAVGQHSLLLTHYRCQIPTCRPAAAGPNRLGTAPSSCFPVPVLQRGRDSSTGCSSSDCGLQGGALTCCLTECAKLSQRNIQALIACALIPGSDQHYLVVVAVLQTSCAV